jgi:hypothetical protein
VHEAGPGPTRKLIRRQRISSYRGIADPCGARVRPTGSGRRLSYRKTRCPLLGRLFDGGEPLSQRIRRLKHHHLAGSDRDLDARLGISAPARPLAPHHERPERGQLLRPTPTAITRPSCRPPRTNPRGSQLFAAFAQPRSWQRPSLCFKSCRYGPGYRYSDGRTRLMTPRLLRNLRAAAFLRSISDAN